MTASRVDRKEKMKDLITGGTCQKLSPFCLFPSNAANIASKDAITSKYKLTSIDKQGSISNAGGINAAVNVLN